MKVICIWLCPEAYLLRSRVWCVARQPWQYKPPGTRKKRGAQSNKTGTAGSSQNREPPQADSGEPKPGFNKSEEHWRTNIT